MVGSVCIPVFKALKDI